MEVHSDDSHPGDHDFAFPLTPFGAAGFIHVSGVRLFVTSLIFAVSVALVFVWAVSLCYQPVVEKAFENSSEDSILADGVYYSGFNSPFTKLGANQYLEIWAVDSTETQTPHTAHIRCLLGPNRIRFSSEIGYYTEFAYPESWFTQTGRSSLLSFWATTERFVPFLLAILFTIIILSLWAVLAVLYMFFVAPFSSMVGRNPGLTACYKLSLCGCFFGGVVFAIAALLYAMDHMSLLMITSFIPGQALAALCFLMLAVFCLPSTREISSPAKSKSKSKSSSSGIPAGNPFKAGSLSSPPPSGGGNPFDKSSKPRKKSNPFE